MSTEADKLDMNANKELFISELEKITRPTDKICEWLTSSDFFDAPASTRFHLSEPGGLCQHSLNVMNRMIQINDSLALGLSHDSIVICSLLHDICKANFYITEKKNRKVNGEWEAYDAYIIDDKFPIGHGEKSVIILQKYMELTAEEVLSIRWHMGAFGLGYQELNSLGSANKMHKVVFALQMADQCTSFWDEA